MQTTFPTRPTLPMRRRAPTLRALAPALAGLLACLLAACAPLPQRAGIPTRWEPSPNFNERSADFVVIHYTSSDSAANALRTLTNPVTEVSAHYLIDARRLDPAARRRAHARVARRRIALGADGDVNSASIGIELDNNGFEPYPPAQIDALLGLLADLRERHHVSAANFLGHADVAPTRKVDPGPLFPWRTLAGQGFGLWCDPPWPTAPPGFDPLLGLRAIGYDTRQPEAAITAFRMHHRPRTRPTRRSSATAT